MNEEWAEPGPRAEGQPPAEQDPLSDEHPQSECFSRADADAESGMLTYPDLREYLSSRLHDLGIRRQLSEGDFKYLAGRAGFVFSEEGELLPTLPSHQELEQFKTWFAEQLALLKHCRLHYERLQPVVICGFRVTREVAERELEKFPEGTFLMRFATMAGMLVISVQSRSGVSHYNMWRAELQATGMEAQVARCPQARHLLDLATGMRYPRNDVLERAYISMAEEAAARKRIRQECASEAEDVTSPPKTESQSVAASSASSISPSQMEWNRAGWGGPGALPQAPTWGMRMPWAPQPAGHGLEAPAVGFGGSGTQPGPLFPPPGVSRSPTAPAFPTPNAPPFPAAALPGFPAPAAPAFPAPAGNPLLHFAPAFPAAVQVTNSGPAATMEEGASAAHSAAPQAPHTRFQSPVALLLAGRQQYEQQKAQQLLRQEWVVWQQQQQGGGAWAPPPQQPLPPPLPQQQQQQGQQGRAPWVAPPQQQQQQQGGVPWVAQPPQDCATLLGQLELLHHHQQHHHHQQFQQQQQQQVRSVGAQAVPLVLGSPSSSPQPPRNMGQLTGAEQQLQRLQLAHQQLQPGRYGPTLESTTPDAGRDDASGGQ